VIQLKPYQLDDLARLSLLNGAILSWGCGLGKTIAMFLWALMKCGWDECRQVLAPVLIISPEDLHKQTAEEGLRFFGVKTRPAASLDYSRPVPPGFYIASYTAVDKIPSTAFKCVVVDEGDKAKKTSSATGMAVRRLKPEYRMIATATPMADRLPDLFWLCSWVCENDPPSARRWPYAPQEREYSAFASRFTCDGGSADVSQLLLLWRCLAPIILRRTMEDTGEKVIGVNHQIVHCKLGTAQMEAYARALNDASDIGVKLGALRRIAGGAVWPNPKLAIALELIANIIGRGEQVLVASDFRGPNDALSERLADASIPHVLMDGRKKPGERAEMADLFKAGVIPAALIGLKSGAEGMSYPRCNNVILMNYSWEYKKLPQVIHRARRINSLRDLNVISLVAQGTIEERMAQLVAEEKGEASDLVLDGVWPTAGVSNEDWMATAVKEFRDLSTIDESVLAGQWPSLKARLQSIYSASDRRSRIRSSDHLSSASQAEASLASTHEDDRRRAA